MVRPSYSTQTLRCSDILGVHSLSSRRYTQSQSHIHRIPLDRRSLPPHCAACIKSSAAQRFRGAGAAVYADGVCHITCCCMLHVACCMLGSASRGPPAGATIYIGEVLIYRVAVAVLRLCRQKLLCEDELGGCLMVLWPTCIPFVPQYGERYSTALQARHGTVPACLPERSTKPPSAVQRSCCNVARCTATGRMLHGCTKCIVACCCMQQCTWCIDARC